MDSYHVLKNQLVQVKQDIAQLISTAKSIPGISDGRFEAWEKVCESFEAEISKDLIRVAVVGAIKSGKSTFVNSLYKKDHLKRGAGVVTSIVTRIRTGRRLCAKLFFKSWMEVNSELEQALVLFPVLAWKHSDETIDIRSSRDRRGLSEAIGRLTSEQLIQGDVRNASSVLISSYLRGYPQVQAYIDSEARIHEFAGDRFPEHRKFVGDDSLAVYLKDIQLEVDGNDPENPLEIADCQGSDSPNPLHVAMIQEYLYLTHFLIYVISSRTGLRQADIKFLSMIKKLGIEKNILFVVNGDFSEHESVEEFRQLVRKVSEEIAMIIAQPDVYSLSALYNLFKAIEKKLPSKDRQRLMQWKDQKQLVALSDRETERFESVFYGRLASGKATLLLKNHLERLNKVNRGLADWFRLHEGVFSREKSGMKAVIEKIQRHQIKAGQLESAVQNSIDGAIPKIRDEFKKELDRFFDVRSKETLGGIIDFARNYRISRRHFEKTLIHSGFSSTLYLIFQDFKNAIDLYIAENVNPLVIQYLNRTERRIQKKLEALAGPYELMVQDTLQAYKTAMADTGIHLEPNRPDPLQLHDIESIKRMAGIQLPALKATMRYSARVRSEAVIRLGFYSALKLVKKILKKPIQGEREEAVFALDDGIRRIKRETEKSIIAHFKDYRENIKYQYVFKLLEALANRLLEMLQAEMRAYSSDLSATTGLIEGQKIDKEEIAKKLSSGLRASESIHERIDCLRKKLI